MIRISLIALTPALSLTGEGERSVTGSLVVPLVLFLTLATSAGAEEVTLRPAKANTIFEEGNLSNGMGVWLFAGKTNANDARRALLAFDVAAAVPAGSTVGRVELQLRMTKTIVGNRPVRLHRVLADWGEGDSNASGEEGRGAPAQTGDATWQRRFFNTESWATPGGDFAAAASATRQVGNTGNYTWNSTPELVGDVQAWVDAPATNFGWIVIADESQAPTAKRFTSNEGSPASQRPMLTIRFTPGIAAPSATPTATVELTATAVPTATVEATATTTTTATTAATSASDTPAASATETPEATVTATVEPTASSTAGMTPTEIANEASATPTETPLAPSCTGDCDANGLVTINELIVGVNIALGNAPVAECVAFDADDTGTVAINELVAAVRNASNGCG